MNIYGDCVYCGGQVDEKTVDIDYRYHGQLFIIENVTAGVCCQCGEQFFKAEVARKLEELAQNQTVPVTTVAVPVLRVS